MADPRKSVAIALEVGKFGSGYVKDASGDPVAPSEFGGVYYTLPPGTWCSHSNEFKAESIYTTGSKLRDTAAYGPFSGSWNIHFIMDYEHTEFLDLIFDNHVIDNDGAAVSNVTTDGGDPVYDHIWTKSNATFVKPFVIREKLLNRIANSANENALDEVVLLKGCIVRSVEFNRNQQGSQMEVRMSGLFADMEVQLAELSVTDYTPYDNTVGPTQYSCMFLDQENDEGYVRDVDSHSVKLDLDTSLVYNTCTPFATAFFEGQTHITWDAKTFANDPLKKFQLRPFSGGKDAMHLKPMAKGLMPMEEAYFTTYNLSMRDTEGLDTFVDAISTSPYLLRFKLEDSTVNAMSWPDGEGEKITDSLQGVETTRLILTVRNTHPTPDWTNKINNNGTGAEYTPVPGLNYVSAKLRPLLNINDLDVTSGSAMDYTMGPGEYIRISNQDINKGMIIKEGTSRSELPSADNYRKLDGWIVLPYSTELYDVPEGAPSTLQALFGLNAESAAALIADNLTINTNWEGLYMQMRDTRYIQVSTPSTLEGYIGKYVKVSNTGNNSNDYVFVSSSNMNSLNITAGTTAAYTASPGAVEATSVNLVKSVPITTLSGTLGEPGTYKHYMIKCYLVPDTSALNGKRLVIEKHGILRIDVSSS